MNDLVVAIDNLTKSHDDLKMSIAALKETNDSTRSQVKVNTENISSIQMSLDKQNRGKNLLIFKLQDIPEFNQDIFGILKKLFDATNLQIPDAVILDAFRLGKKIGKRPLLVKFNSARWVRAAFEKLAEFKKLHLAIANDLTPAERERRKSLLSLCRQLMESGRDARVKRDRLVVDGKVIDMGSEATILREISTNNPTSNTSSVLLDSTAHLQQSSNMPIIAPATLQQPLAQTKSSFADVTAQTPHSRSKRGRPTNATRLGKTSPDNKQSRIDVFATPRNDSNQLQFYSPSANSALASEASKNAMDAS